MSSTPAITRASAEGAVEYECESNLEQIRITIVSLNTQEGLGIRLPKVLA
jgi:hypothetical protein